MPSVGVLLPLQLKFDFLELILKNRVTTAASLWNVVSGAWISA